MLGFDSTSRWVIVVWLMNWMVREVSGAWSLAKNAPVRASATAPSMANDQRCRVAGDRRGDAALDADAEDAAVAVDDGDDGVVAGGRRPPPGRAAC